MTALIDAVYSWEDRANSSDYDDYVASQEIPGMLVLVQGIIEHSHIPLMLEKRVQRSDTL